MNEPATEIHYAQQAFAWMSEEDNVHAWREVAALCPWGKPFQYPDFAMTWLNSYGTEWQPLLVININSDGRLAGILPLAKRGNLVTGIGARQAEYQGWLCIGEDAMAIFDAMLTCFFNEFPTANLQLGYIDLGQYAPGVIRELTSRSNISLSEFQRPLLELDSEALVASLRKSSNRSKLNRLKRLGNLEFHVDEIDEGLAAQLEQVIALYDFRQGAINGVSPFHEDPHKRTFHLDWLLTKPSTLRFYRLTLDGEIIAALLGVDGGNMVSNAILASSATLARHSPGKLIIYMVGEHMASQDYQWLDLTPGGDAWKERFATNHDTVFRISAWADDGPPKMERRKEAVNRLVRKLIRTAGTSPETVRSVSARIVGKLRRPASIIANLKNLAPQTIEYRIYRMTGADSVNILPSQTLQPRVNSISDLLLFDSSAAPSNRQDFLAAALERLERGERCYTVAENGRLLHVGWQHSGQKNSFFTEVQQNYDYAPAGNVLYDFYTHPGARGRGLYQQTLAFILQHLAQEHSLTSSTEPDVTYISALANNHPSIHVIEKLGFEYVASISRKRIFNRFPDTHESTQDPAP
jgi:CelD/BcsL family acetyltransferase involved in cellulose biosynthesis/GNAT superfamily N-acetyltransferase